MKRSKKKTLATLSGRGRRRAMALYRQLFRFDPLGKTGVIHVAHAYACNGHGAEIRNAERLAKAGLVTAVATKYNWRGDRIPRELALYLRKADALKAYLQSTLLPGRGL